MNKKKSLPKHIMQRIKRNRLYHFGNEPCKFDGIIEKNERKVMKRKHYLDTEHHVLIVRMNL